jgi:hypothetical protein
MAVSFKSVGTFAQGGNPASITPPLPTGLASGDMMLCFVGGKDVNSNQTINNSWISLGKFTNGTGASQQDGGSMFMSVFYKIHTGTETAPTVTGSNYQAVGGIIIAFSKTLTFWDTPISSGGGDTSNGTSFIVGGVPTISVATNDMLVGYAAIPNDNSTQSAITITMTGVTFGSAFIEAQGDLQNTNRDQMSMSGGYRLATGGSGTANPVYQSTLSVGSTGTAAIVRLRDQSLNPAASIDPFGMMGFFGI